MMKNFLLLFVLFALTPFLTFCVTPPHDFDVQALLQTRHIRLIVMRHGEATHNLKDLVTSSTTPGIYLTEQGVEQVKQVAQQLASERIHAIYVSPLFRSLQTAQIMGTELHIPYRDVVVSDLLREQFFGQLEDHTYAEYMSHFHRSDSIYKKAPPGGEPGSVVHKRTRQFIWEMAAKHYRETVLVITHDINCCHIHKLLTGSYHCHLSPGEFKIYDFRKG